jgi:hypothetical protein
MWGAFNIHSGMPYETTFPYTSETSSWFNGFLYGDPLRIHTNTFYQLSYLMGEAFGIGGSYVPYQIIYALLWWARGVLVFLLLRRFLPSCLAVCYAAGALVIVHASDGALLWVGQMNQFGFIFWMLAAFYFLTLAFDSAHYGWAALFTMAACLFESMSMFSYESPLLLLLVFPLALLAKRRTWRRLAVLTAAWYCVPACYLLLTLRRYLAATGATYQESVMRKGWGLGSLMSDWSFNVVASLKFWEWPRGGWKTSESQAILLSLVAAMIFVAGGIAAIRVVRENGKTNPFVESVQSVRTWLALLTAGLVLLVLSFPVYLLLDSARGLWRTQFLSGVGSGLTLTAMAGLVSHGVSRRPVRTAVFLVLGAVIVCFGSISAIQKGGFHRWVWERHRAAMAKILRAAPSVKPDTIVVLTNVPKDSDPFGDSMWLDVSLRLAYPGIPVAGTYFYADGTRSPGNNLVAVGELWKWDGTGFPTAVREAPVANTIIVDSGQANAGSLVNVMPAFVCRAACAVQSYNPAAVITGPIAPRAARRYGIQ